MSPRNTQNSQIGGKGERDAVPLSLFFLGAFAASREIKPGTGNLLGVAIRVDFFPFREFRVVRGQFHPIPTFFVSSPGFVVSNLRILIR